MMMMKGMKQFLATALSTAMAFTLAFAAAPAQRAEAASTAVPVRHILNEQESSDYVEDTKYSATIETDITLPSGTQVNMDAYWPMKEGATPAEGFKTVVAYSLYVSSAEIIPSGGGTLTVPVPEGYVGTGATLNTATVWDETSHSNIDISSEVSGISSTTSTITFTLADIGTSSFKTFSFNLKDASSDSSSDSGSSSDSSSDSGSSSGGSSSSAAAMAAIAAATGTSTTSAATTPVAAESAKPDMSANSSIDSAKVKTAANGTAKISNIKSEATEVEIDSTVEVDGVSYKVKTIGKGALKNCDNVEIVTIPASVTKIEAGAFTGAENLKTVKINTKSSIKVEKGAFKGVDTTKMTIKVSKKMSDKQFAKLQKNLTKAGYKGKVRRSL